MAIIVCLGLLLVSPPSFAQPVAEDTLPLASACAAFHGFTFILAIWVAGGSLLGKLFNKQIQAGRHLRVTLLGLVLLCIVDGSSGCWPSPSTDPGSTLMRHWFCSSAWAQLCLPARVSFQLSDCRNWARSSTVLPAIGVSAYRLEQYGRIGHASAKHSMTSLYHPAHRLSKGVSTRRFVAQAGSLTARLDAQASGPAEEDLEYPE